MKTARSTPTCPPVPLTDLPGLVADLGLFPHRALAARGLPAFFLHPRADKAQIAGFSKALTAAGVQVSSVLPLYRWSGPDETERQAAVRYWKRAIQIAVDLGVTVMNSEFNGRPEAPSASEAQFWRSLEELLPVFEREGIHPVLEPHPDDFVEDGGLASISSAGSTRTGVVPVLRAAHLPPGRRHRGIMRYAGPLLTHVHIADSFHHRASSGLRYIVNPPGSAARVHQHLDIGQGTWMGRLLPHAHRGELRRHRVRVRLRREERARESSTDNLEQIRQYLAKHGGPLDR